MTIDRINPIDPIQPGKKPGQTGRVEPQRDDSISLSREAVEKSELYRVQELVAAAPDVRLDRIEELRQKINDPSYLNEAVIRATADKILDAFVL
ncbi:MAG: flagellar biosynthesis anti-sigma factor FlgM [Treponema sp.]|nr:flagellar biosynthesis anti-sigma factor FlgM [Treponema sp.]